MYLWADAICIDQTSNEERASQILLMEDIFRSAETVYAWLGEAQDGSHKAIELLGDLARFVLKRKARGRGTITGCLATCTGRA